MLICWSDSSSTGSAVAGSSVGSAAAGIVVAGSAAAGHGRWPRVPASVS